MALHPSWKIFLSTVILAGGGAVSAARAAANVAAPANTLPVPVVPVAGTPAPVAAMSLSRGPVFNETLKLFRLALSPSMRGSEVMGSLKSTHDPALTPFFIQISHSKSPELRLIGLIDANAVSKNSALVSIPKLLAIPIPRLIGPSLAVIIQSGKISTPQLVQVMNTAVEPSEKLMAASELVNRGKATLAVKVLEALTSSQTDSTRYYAALSLVQCGQADQTVRGLQLLMQLAARRARRLTELKDALLARVAGQKIAAAAPWAQKIAGDKANSWSLRRRAVQSLLVLGAPTGPALLAQMLRSAHGTIDKIELGLLAIEYPQGLVPADLANLKQTDSPLLTGIDRTAQLAVSGKNPLPGILALIQQGQPILLNWALAYAEFSSTPHRLTLLKALIGYATASGGGDNTDFRRAVAAATVLANGNTPAERKLLAADMDSANAGIVEAALAGMIQSRHANFANLIAPYWPEMLKRDHRKIREFAAMELAREGKKMELPVLRNIVLYGLRRSDGFRAAAGWYDLKITGRGEALLAAVAEGKKTIAPSHETR
jgi:hypothetical protein